MTPKVRPAQLRLAFGQAGRHMSSLSRGATVRRQTRSPRWRPGARTAAAVRVAGRCNDARPLCLRQGAALPQVLEARWRRLGHRHVALGAVHVQGEGPLHVCEPSGVHQTRVVGKDMGEGRARSRGGRASPRASAWPPKTSRRKQRPVALRPPRAVACAVVPQAVKARWCACQCWARGAGAGGVGRWRGGAGGHPLNRQPEAMRTTPTAALVGSPARLRLLAGPPRPVCRPCHPH